MVDELFRFSAILRCIPMTAGRRLKLNVGERYGKWIIIGEPKPQTGNRLPALWLCRCDCGTERRVKASSLNTGRSRSCGCAKSDPRINCRGPNHGNWKGGRTKTNGYVQVNVVLPGETKRKRVFEHVAIMSFHLGRKLYPNEQVHHKNGIRDDNRFENLELWTRQHPTGARVKDLVEYSEEILKLYAPHKLK